MKNLLLLKKPLFNLTLISAFILTFVSVAYPCKCVKQTQSKYYKLADAIVNAKVTEINNIDNQTVEVKLHIYDSWKANLPQTFTILIGKTSCDYDLKVSEEYLLYLKNFEDNKWTTNSCMGNLLKNKSGNVQKWLKAKGKKSVVT